MKLSIFSSLLLIFTSCVSLPTHADATQGFSLGGTRLIFPGDKRDAIFPIYNTTTDRTYLVQSWVGTTVLGDERAKDFIIVPPLFRMNPNSSNKITVLYTGSDLPKDKESIFYLNVKAIPGIPEEVVKKHQNSLQIAFNNEIKLIYRPVNLTPKIDIAIKKLTFHINKDQLNINNPTPYYMTIFRIGINGKTTNLGNAGLVPPYTNINVKVAGASPGKITYYLINDYGAVISLDTTVS